MEQKSSIYRHDGVASKIDGSMKRDVTCVCTVLYCIYSIPRKRRTQEQYYDVCLSSTFCTRIPASFLFSSSTGSVRLLLLLLWYRVRRKGKREAA
mmetsp:Transcript_37700/g.38149  ORF Transcript_37700/g.38149 Transcript_37700/m.38149 type:complete len:95 (+) Transcript_37700:150-434(+)